MGLHNPRPLRCIHPKPTPKSVLFCGEYIHFPSIALLTNYSLAYISYIFARKKEPSLEAAEKIAGALKMGLEEFLMGLRGRVQHHKSSGGHSTIHKGVRNPRDRRRKLVAAD